MIQIGDAIRRSDGHLFFLLQYPDGEHIISAGCRRFTFSEAWQHWYKRHAKPTEYIPKDQTRKYRWPYLYHESLSILLEFEKRIGLTTKQKFFMRHRPFLYKERPHIDLKYETWDYDRRLD